MLFRDIESKFIHSLQLHRRKKHRVHQDVEKAHELYQVSTLSVLMEGLYEGPTTYGELAKHGDFGLGTLNGLDGEMIAFEREFYQILSDGSAKPVAPSMKTPFAVVIHFGADIRLDLPNPMPMHEFEALLKQIAPSHLAFYAIRLEGHFDHVKVRNVPRQEKPYAPLSEVVKDFPVSELQNLRGTMVGFRCPDYSLGINVPGYHLHFIDENRQFGGHVMSFSSDFSTLEIDHTLNLRMEIPKGYILAERSRNPRIDTRTEPLES